MTQLLDIRADRPLREPGPLPATGDSPVTTDEVVLYGDFTCPWSYLAQRRATRLAADGMAVDWRAVRRRPRQAHQRTDSEGELQRLRDDMDRVLASLLPGEELPYSLAGFVPETEAAVSGYAEAYVAGVAEQVRTLLFNAFWMGSVDLDDPALVRTLLVDAVRCGASPSEPVRDWGYLVDNTGGPVSTSAWRCVRRWASDRAATGAPELPVLLAGSTPLLGAAAVRWLGSELVRRGLEDDPNPAPTVTAPSTARDLASLSWVSEHGNRWMRAYQRAHRPLAT